MASMYVMTEYRARASCGATPAYIAWNPKMRCSRSSSKNDATLRPSRPNPPRRTRRLPARHRRTRSSAESKSASMKFGISTRYSSVNQSAKRPNAAAASGPANVRISSAIASRPWRTWSTDPSAYTARYIGSTGRSST